MLFIFVSHSLFVRFYWDYTRKDREVAEERYEKTKKEGSANPPPLPPLRPPFRPITSLLTTKVTNDIVSFSSNYSIIM